MMAQDIRSDFPILKDAVYLDSSNLTQEEVVQEVLRLAQEKLAVREGDNTPR